jgi:hypothetical protein
MACGRPRPSGAASDVDYWLRRCDGFRVDSPEGRVGVVEEVRYASRCDRPDVLAVRAGLLGRLLLIVPVAEVAWILPGKEQVVLYGSPRPTATERPQDLRRRVQLRGRREASRGPNASEPEPSASNQREVEAVITRLTRRVGLRLGRGGEERVTPDIEESAEPSAEEPSAEQQAEGERAAKEAPAEVAAEAAADEPAPEQAAAEEPPAEERTTP